MCLLPEVDHSKIIVLDLICFVVDHCKMLLSHYQSFFSAMNEVHEYLSQQRSVLI